MPEIKISKRHFIGLQIINSSYYENKDLGKTVETMIEEHFCREHWNFQEDTYGEMTEDEYQEVLKEEGIIS